MLRALTVRAYYITIMVTPTSASSPPPPTHAALPNREIRPNNDVTTAVALLGRWCMRTSSDFFGLSNTSSRA